MKGRVKVTIVGAGNVGASCAQRIAEKGYADVVLLDIIEGLPQGKALDIQQSANIIGFNSKITGTNNYETTAKSDVVIITSGVARKPGMSRDDLLITNQKIVSEVTRNIAKYSPNCVIIIATNPVDAMVYLALHESKFPRRRVLGLSGVLDGARLATFIAEELKVSVEDISPCVIGEHGKSMVVIPRLTTVKGTPITQLLPADKIAKLIDRTVNGGAEIVALLKTGSAFYAPSAALVEMAESVIKNKKRVLICAARVDGEYGIRDTVLGMPVKLSKNGIEQMVKLELTTEEKTALANSAKAVQELIQVMKLK
ncbi:MAG: malate dehydrogenase [Dehalococcoidales bacterium]|nr:malate dehydrogenase [Dehalococcoidales bacterium]